MSFFHIKRIFYHVVASTSNMWSQKQKILNNKNYFCRTFLYFMYIDVFLSLGTFSYSFLLPSFLGLCVSVSSFLPHLISVFLSLFYGQFVLVLFLLFLKDGMCCRSLYEDILGLTTQKKQFCPHQPKNNKN